MRIRTLASLADLQRHLGFPATGAITEADIDEVSTECDLHARRRRDAEVLTTLAARMRGAATCADAPNPSPQPSPLIR